MGSPYVYADVTEGCIGQHEVSLYFDREDEESSMQVLVTLARDEDDLVDRVRVVARYDAHDPDEGWRVVDEPAPHEVVALIDGDPEVIGMLEHCHRQWSSRAGAQ